MVIGTVLDSPLTHKQHQILGTRRLYSLLHLLLTAIIYYQPFSFSYNVVRKSAWRHHFFRTIFVFLLLLQLLQAFMLSRNVNKLLDKMVSTYSNSTNCNCKDSYSL